MGLNSVLSLEASIGSNESVMPLRVKKGSISSVLSEMNIETILTNSELNITNRLVAINSTKNLYPLHLLKLEGNDDYLIVGIYEHSEDCILNFILRLTDVKEKEFEGKNKSEVISQLCLTYESLQLGSISEVSSYLSIQEGLGLISGDVHHSTLDNLLDTNEKIKQSGRTLYQSPFRDKYTKGSPALISADPLKEINNPTKKEFTRDLNHLRMIEFLISISLRSLISSGGRSDYRGYSTSIASMTFMTAHLDNPNRLGKFDFRIALGIVAEESELNSLKELSKEFSKFNLNVEALTDRNTDITKAMLCSVLSPLVFEIIIYVTHCEPKEVYEILSEQAERLADTPFKESNAIGVKLQTYLGAILGILNNKGILSEGDVENSKNYIELNLKDIISKFN